jgi:hypothetical protein
MAWTCPPTPLLSQSLAPLKEVLPRTNKINVPQWKFHQPIKTGVPIMPFTAKLPAIEMDIAKRVFHMEH